MKSFELTSRLRISHIVDADILSHDTIGRICDSFVMVYVICGKIGLTMANEVFEIDEGTVTIVSSNEFHCIKETEHSKYAYIEFTSDETSLDNKITFLSNQEIELMDEACKIISGTQDSVSLQRLYTTLEFVLVSCSFKEKQFPLKKEKDAALFSKASEIMKHNLTQQLSVSTLADSLNLSLSHLKRVFAKYTLIGVHEYFTCLKIARAKELLKLGETVTRTAELSGFSNQAYFSAAFKRITGISPKEFAGNTKAHRIQKQKTKPDKPLNSQKDLPNYLL